MRECICPSFSVILTAQVQLSVPASATRGQNEDASLIYIGRAFAADAEILSCVRFHPLYFVSNYMPLHTMTTCDSWFRSLLRLSCLCLWATHSY